MTKVIIILISLLIIFCIVLVFILKNQSKKYSTLKTQYQEIKDSYLLVTKEKLELQEKIENERKNKMELAKKLAKYSNMSTDDILHELQNDGNNKN